MKNVKLAIIPVIVGMIMLTMGGCIETKMYVKERVDQTIDGNRGYLENTSPALKVEAPLPKTRSIIGVDIEIPPYSTWERRHSYDGELWGNKGYMPILPFDTSPEQEGFIQSVPLPYKDEEVKEIPVSKRGNSKEETQKIISKKKEDALSVYTVRENETLQDIAARPEIYNDFSRWVEIYKANKEKVKNPDKIYPGQVLVIPRE